MVAPRTVIAGLRPEIQALRAVAVLLVVGYHLWPSKLSGGFIGVDVFFVISGFLITAHLLREVSRTGTLKLTQFWARRIRRLLPAAFTVLIGCLVAALLWLPRSVWQQTFQEISASALYGLNWLLAFNSTDYLAAENKASIVQHFWSLSVEEQFYLIWPLLILTAIGVVAWRQKDSSRARRKSLNVRAIAIALGIVFGASMVFSVLETARSQPSAFFVTPTRAWEFAAGGLLAFVPATLLGKLSESKATIIRSAASWVGFTAIGVAAVTFSGQSAFPGYIALLPVIGTVLVIWAGHVEHPWATTHGVRFGPIQFLGDISYSVYLWHWPLIVLYPYVRGNAPELKGGLSILAVTIVLAWATKYFIEDPVRRRLFWTSSRRRSYICAAAGMAVIVAGTSLASWNLERTNQEIRAAASAAMAAAAECFGAPAMLPDANCPSSHELSDDFDLAFFNADDGEFSERTIEGQSCYSYSASADPMVMSCELGDVISPRFSIALVGDSHAVRIAESLESYAIVNRWRLVTYLRGSCPGLSLEENGVGGDQTPVETCFAWTNAVHDELIEDDDIDLVLFHNHTESYTSTYELPRVLLEPPVVAQRFAELQAAGRMVAVVRDVPGIPSGEKATDCIASSGGVVDPCSFRRDEAVTDDAMTKAVSMSDGVPLLDLSSFFCDSSRCHSLVGGLVVYFDSNHLTQSFSDTLAPYIGKKIETIFTD